MTAAFQGSLLDGLEPAGPGDLTGTVHRTLLSDGAWVDVRPAWLSGADALFERLRDTVPWRAERAADVRPGGRRPAAAHFYDEDEPLPDPLLDEARRPRSTRTTRAELGEPFATAGLCLYRDGRDSVAWHGDRIGRGRTARHDGRDRRPRRPARAAAAPARRRRRRCAHELGHGDLLVMGGSCQRTWEHAVPKTARPAGPRISIQFRPRGVR